MSIILRRDPRNVIPDFIDWFEEPFLTLKPYLGQPIRIEDYIEGLRSLAVSPKVTPLLRVPPIWQAGPPWCASRRRTAPPGHG